MGSLQRPVTTLFMCMSVDGKISTGEDDGFDFDVDLPKIPGVKEGLHQYYEIEQTTDMWTLCSGKTKEKCYKQHQLTWNGVQLPIVCVVVDNTHLSENCIRFLSMQYEHVIIATSRSDYSLGSGLSNTSKVQYPEGDMAACLSQLYEMGCEKLTLQCGGTLNTVFLRSGLIDRLNLVVAPLLVGGTKTPTLFDGCGVDIFRKFEELAPLQLVEVNWLANSYLQLIYDVARSDSKQSLSLKRMRLI